MLLYIIFSYLMCSGEVAVKFNIIIIIEENNRGSEALSTLQFKGICRKVYLITQTVPGLLNIKKSKKVEKTISEAKI